MRTHARARTHTHTHTHTRTERERETSRKDKSELLALVSQNVRGERGVGVSDDIQCGRSGSMSDRFRVYGLVQTRQELQPH